MRLHYPGNSSGFDEWVRGHGGTVCWLTSKAGRRRQALRLATRSYTLSVSPAASPRPGLRLHSFMAGLGVSGRFFSFAGAAKTGCTIGSSPSMRAETIHPAHGLVIVRPARRPRGHHPQTNSVWALRVSEIAKFQSTKRRTSPLSTAGSRVVAAALGLPTSPKAHPSPPARITARVKRCRSARSLRLGQVRVMEER